MRRALASSSTSVRTLCAACTPRPSVHEQTMKRWTSSSSSRSSSSTTQIPNSTNLTKPSSSLFTNSEKPFYVSTPIFYVNASPHIGHLHTLVLTDTLARFARLRNPNREVLFNTGTDEHGMKIQQAAKAFGVGEREFCDGVSERFRDLARRSGMSNTSFIRTSEDRHHTAVKHFWGKLVASGDIYKGTHSGWYSISDECFYSPSQITKLEDGSGKVVATETGNEVVLEQEENWKFRLTAYKDKLREWLLKPESIWPNVYRQSLLRQLDTLEDLSVSRPKSRVQWGVPVPSDSEQTMYVWVDALVNYLTVLGYPESEMPAWPCDVQVIGKDIVKFHALHWPALLMSAGLPPPTRVMAHAHWTMGKSKMSKSRGNVVNPLEALDKWGVDGVRWYLMRVGGSLADDADYSEEEMNVNYRILADQIGNLLSRISSPRILGKMGPFTPEDKDPAFEASLTGLRDVVCDHMDVYAVSKACDSILEVIASANRMLTTHQPWASPNPTKSIVYAYETLRLSGILLQPFMPFKSAELLDRLGIDTQKRGWEDCVLPERVDVGALVQGLKGGKRPGHLFPPLK